MEKRENDDLTKIFLMSENNRISHDTFEQYKSIADMFKKIEAVSNAYDSYLSASAQYKSVADMFKKVDAASNPFGSYLSASAQYKSVADMFIKVDAASNAYDSYLSASAQYKSIADMFKKVDAASNPFVSSLSDLLNISEAIIHLSPDRFNASTAVQFTSTLNTALSIDATQPDSKSEIDKIESSLSKIFSQRFANLEDTLQSISNELKSLKEPFIQKAFIFFIQLFLPILISPFIQLPYEKLIKEHANKTFKQPAIVAARIHFSSFRIVTCPNLIARTHPSPKSIRIGTIQKGQVIEILYKNSKWAYIQWQVDNIGTYNQGWVNSKYLKRIK